MCAEQEILNQISTQLQCGNAPEVKALTEKAIAEKIPAEQILYGGLVSGMEIIGIKFKNNEVFIPEVLIAARAMKAGMMLVKPMLVEANIKAKGKVIIGTVKGDLHDIGKNIVSMLLEGAGFDVINMGTDVSLEMILDYIKKDNPDVVGLSALLTTTMVYMSKIVKGLEEAQLREQVKIIIGGAPITQAYADDINADGYAPDAASSVDLVKRLLQITD